MDQLSFGLEDLKFMKLLLETLTKRAAFQPSELGDIGLLYNKLTAFVAGAEASIQNANQTEQNKEAQ